MARNGCPRCGDKGLLPGRGRTPGRAWKGDLCSCPAADEIRRSEAELTLLKLAEIHRHQQKSARIKNPSPRQIPEPPLDLPPMPARREPSLVRDLETLAELHEKGLLTEEEFDAAKKRLLGS